MLSSVNVSLASSLLNPDFQPKQTKTIKLNYFNLANIVDSFLSSDNKISSNALDKKMAIRRDFINISSKFNQGNAAVAYDEYEKLIDKIDNDTSLLTLSRVFYEIGYFSLALKANEKIIYKNQFYENMLDLEKSYKPKANLTKEQEIYFAKVYNSIYFDNSAQEAIVELTSKKNEYNKNDYYQYMLSRAYLENKKYSEAQNAINKAISINSSNVSYQLFKVNILIGMKKYSDALKLLKKIEKTSLTVDFADELNIQKEYLMSLNTNNTKEKKYHTVKKLYLEGNFEKAKKDAQNILNFDKDNSKILTLYAKSELALGNIERANSYFVNSYKSDKKNNETLVGIADIKYLHGDYKNSTKAYKKAYKNDKTDNEILIKLALSEKQYTKKQKELKKIEAKLDKISKVSYLDYYHAALSIAQKNDVLKEDLLKKALLINPMHENSLGALVELYIKNKNFELAKGLIYNVSFTLGKNYYYYYLCGLYNQALGNKKEAMQFYKTSLNLNSNFEIANTKILKLIPDVVNEEI